MVIALSGRRIDAPDAAQARFPLARADEVRVALRDFFQQHKATFLVCSGACGADLLALSEAGKLRLRRRVVLPFGRERFRESSVVDRPGDWGELYDSIMNELEALGDVLVLSCPEDEQAYEDVNQFILREAIAEARAPGEQVAALLVWDGESRGNNDFTASFGEAARRNDIPVHEIRTNDQGV